MTIAQKIKHTPRHARLQRRSLPARVIRRQRILLGRLRQSLATRDIPEVQLASRLALSRSERVWRPIFATVLACVTPRKLLAGRWKQPGVVRSKSMPPYLHCGRSGRWTEDGR